MCEIKKKLCEIKFVPGDKSKKTKQRMKQQNDTRKEMIEKEFFFTTSRTFLLKRKKEVAYQIKML